MEAGEGAKGHVLYLFASPARVMESSGNTQQTSTEALPFIASHLPATVARFGVA